MNMMRQITRLVTVGLSPLRRTYASHSPCWPFSPIPPPQHQGCHNQDGKEQEDQTGDGQYNHFSIPPSPCAARAVPD
jgi:hypothetical protein